VDGPYQDELRRCVGQITAYVKDVELHDGLLLHSLARRHSKQPVAWDRTSESQSQDPLPGRSGAMGGRGFRSRLTRPERCRYGLATMGWCVGVDASWWWVMP
jgi:hypothetical protein